MFIRSGPGASWHESYVMRKWLLVSSTLTTGSTGVQPLSTENSTGYLNMAWITAVMRLKENKFLLWVKLKKMEHLFLFCASRSWGKWDLSGGGKVASYESSSDQVISLQVQAIRVVKKYLFKLQNDPLSSGQTAQTKQPFRSSFVDSF